MSDYQIKILPETYLANKLCYCNPQQNGKEGFNQLIKVKRAHSEL